MIEGGEQEEKEQNSFVLKHMAVGGRVKECEIKYLSDVEAVDSRTLVFKLRIL